MADRLITWGVGALLLGIPWHEVAVHLWLPLGAWDEAVLLGLAVLLALRAPDRWRATPLLVPMGALVLVSLLSAGLRGTGLRLEMLPYLVGGLAASQLAPEGARRLCRGLVATAALAASYGIVTFLAFRSIGGRIHSRPPVDGTLLETLVWPYYSGAYPRGAHLVGPFLNELYLGTWLAGVAGLACVLAAHARGRSRRLLAGAAAATLVAVAWTYSRSALLALVVVCLYLAVRLSRRLLLVLVVAGLLALPLAQAQDWNKFAGGVDVIRRSVAGRLAAVERGLHVLGGGSLFGEGPGAVRLADMQYAKVAVEMGWAGVLALGWLLLAGLRPAFRGDAPAEAVGLGAVALALCVCGLGGDFLEVPQTAHTLWIALGLATAVEARAG